MDFPRAWKWWRRNRQSAAKLTGIGTADKLNQRVVSNKTCPAAVAPNTLRAMRLLDRYLFRELLTPLAYCLGGFLIFWMSYDLFSDAG